MLPRAIAALLLCVCGSALCQSSVLISQIYGGGGNTGASYRNDFVELFNRSSNAVNLAGWSVQYAAATSAIWQVTALTATIQPGGYYLVQQAGGVTGSNLPTADVVGTIFISATAGKLALVSNSTPLSGSCPLSGAAVVDFVGYGTTASCSEGMPAAAPGNTTALRRLNEGCIDTDDNAADFFVSTVSPRNSSSPILDCNMPARTYAIHELQGTNSTSPLVGQFVATTTNIVTALRNNGFFIQAADGEIDGDPHSSEGLYVSSGSINVAVGDAVVVSGIVSEFKPASDPDSPSRTQISSVAVKYISGSNALPTPIILTTNDTLPNGGHERLERFEGMRVRVEALRVVAPTGGFIHETTATATSSGVFFGVIDPLLRPFREPGIHALNPLPSNAPCCVPRFDGNPQLLRIDSNGRLGTTPLEVASGTILSNVVGPLFYEARNYTILPDGLPDSTGLALPASKLRSQMSDLCIASMNLERFYDATDDASVGDAVLTPEAYGHRLHKAGLLLEQVMHTPDIVGLAEIENLAVLQNLAATIPSAPYAALLLPGNDSSGINVGFLINTARVTVVEIAQEGKNATFTNPNTGAQSILHDRPPLVLRAAVPDPRSAHALHLTIIMTHLRSMIDIDDPAAGPFVRAKRRAQGESVAQLVQQRQSAGEEVVVMGDFNAFEFSDGYADVLGTILGSPAPSNEVVLASADSVSPDLINLIETLPVLERYSYVFDGNAQALDHILVSRGLQPRVTRFLYLRNNADFPETCRNDLSSPHRISDHDPAIACLAPGPLARITSIQHTATAVVLEGEAPPVRIYELERSADLRIWLKVESAAVDQTGRFSLTDFNPVSGAAFYRLRATDQN
jgi:predicted extracellular nuclease